MSGRVALYWQDTPSEIIDHIVSLLVAPKEAANIALVRCLCKRYSQENEMYVYLWAPSTPMQAMVTFMLKYMISYRNEQGRLVDMPLNLYTSLYYAVFRRCGIPRKPKLCYDNSCAIYNLITNHAFLDGIFEGASERDKARVKWLMTRVFKYLDRFYVKRLNLVELHEALIPKDGPFSVPPRQWPAEAVE
jgi:hypothetical protein